MPKGLIALAIGGFGIGLTEFVIAGLLPQVADSLSVSDAAAGTLISGYAIAVAAGAIVLTAALGSVGPKRALLALMVLFIVGNVVSAVAPTYAVMLLGRILAALCHGAFFGIGAVVASDLVQPERRARAIAVMFGGLTLANVLGVPAGTLVGQLSGWRTTFAAIAVIGLIALVGIALLTPDVRHATSGSLRHEFRVFRVPQVWLGLAVTVLGYGGMFGAFTFIAYTLTRVSGFDEAVVPLLLVAFGVGLFVGNLAGGWTADRHPVATVIVSLAALAGTMLVFFVFAGQPVVAVVCLVAMGAFGFSGTPAMQNRVLRAAQSAPTLGSGANIAAFNVGNAIGALIAGASIDAGLGFASPLLAGALIVLLGLVVFVLAVRVKPTPSTDPLTA